MGLISGIFGLPFAPVRGTVWIAEQVQEQAEQQYYDPEVIRRQLEAVDEGREDGSLTEAEAEDIEDELVARLMEGRRLRDEREGRAR